MPKCIDLGGKEPWLQFGGFNSERKETSSSSLKQQQKVFSLVRNMDSLISSNGVRREVEATCRKTACSAFVAEKNHYSTQLKGEN